MAIINNITNFTSSPLSVLTLTLGVLVAFYIQREYTESKACSPETRKRRAILITGASRGIGKTIALHLSSLGYTVFGSVRSQASADKLISASKDNNDNNNKVQEHGQIIPVIFDVTKDTEIQTAVTTIEKVCQEKELDFTALINNAGINPEGDQYAKVFGESGKAPANMLSDSALVTNVFDTNVVGCFRVTKAFLPLLQKGKNGEASIVLVGSFFGSIAGALNLSHLAYESSKFALEGLADGLRRGLKKEHITVTLIKPGNIQTEMNKMAGEVSPLVVANDILVAIEDPNPSARYYPGLVQGTSCKLACMFFSLFPTWITDKQLS